MAELMDLDSTLVKSASRSGRNSRAQRVLDIGVPLVQKGGLASPILAFIVKKAFDKGVELDQEQAQQFNAELMELLTDKETNAQDKFIDAIGIGQKYGMDVKDVVDIVKAYQQLAPKPDEMVATPEELTAFREQNPNMPVSGKIRLPSGAVVNAGDLPQPKEPKDREAIFESPEALSQAMGQIPEEMRPQVRLSGKLKFPDITGDEPVNFNVSNVSLEDLLYMQAYQKTRGRLTAEKEAGPLPGRIPQQSKEKPVSAEGTTPAAVPAAPKAPAGAAASGERVKVISPAGMPGSIPKEKLEKALKAGYRLAE